MYVEPGTGDKWLPEECHFVDLEEFPDNLNNIQRTILCIYFDPTECTHCGWEADKDG